MERYLLDDQLSPLDRAVAGASATLRPEGIDANDMAAKAKWTVMMIKKEGQGGHTA